MLGVDALVFGNDNIAVLVDDVKARLLALEPLGHEFHLGALGHQLEVVEGKEMRQDLLGREAQGLHQDCDGHLATTVDSEIENVLGVELEVEPGATVRDDSGREEQLARAVGLAPVVLEECARRAVQLTHDDTLGAVDHERAGVGDQGHLAHVDLLLLDLFDRGLGRLAVEDDEPHARAQWRCKGQASLLAFLHVEGGHAELVVHELEPCHAVVAGDREDGLKGRLEARLVSSIRGPVGLEEVSIRLKLGLEQIRNLQHRWAFCKALAEAFLFSKVVGHSGPRGLKKKGLT